MRHSSTFRVVMTALFAALICVSTMFIRIASPINGYLHLGDGFVLVSAYLLGPVYGAAASGIGSMLADWFSGYPLFVLGTLPTKALTAFVAGYVYRRLLRGGQKPLWALLLSGLCGEACMVAGYFLYAFLFLGYGMMAAIEIPLNLCQAAAGIAVAAAVTPALLKSPEIRSFVDIPVTTQFPPDKKLQD